MFQAKRQNTSALFNAAAAPSLSQSAHVPLSPDVQRNLFQVGMRVRKSVNAGYKTKTQSIFPTTEKNVTPPPTFILSTSSTLFNPAAAPHGLLPFSAGPVKSLKRSRSDQDDEVEPLSQDVIMGDGGRLAGSQRNVDVTPENDFEEASFLQPIERL
ncbi:hypothetical protein SAICODRAFT_6293 [Saitoella complicata NRRL Y-17804]|uniref:uncharacterized protein n=1 Tax=Saitoella complicata (strain BCRC 22490 / CBS 7301 / JCM 7358 / NBRC 10748 / NRRL Y-17804) TaxID=698492 RepID=UPI0008672217|nr:uncharacterized protein SAICODRAFT_6293 [Saitoella complicata NRRL Y-17804]ODQ54557.1 hypothetical protein SAICODRAFT_6293 [Saitoella complicata NRRL Y-17804]